VYRWKFTAMGVAKMSEGNATMDTMNKCYKCEAELSYDAGDDVHPLCDSCDDDFMDWFRSQL
jgi:hypothetical protein